MADGPACPACGNRIGLRDGFEICAADTAGAEAGFDPAYFATLAKLEDANFWFQARNRLIVRAMRRYFPACRSFLEIGCGTAQVLRAIARALPSIRLAGSELFMEGLTFARERVPAAHLMQMDATRIPYTEEFDVIGAFDVIEHIADDVRVLAEIHRALKPGAGAILTVPQHPWLWSHQDEVAHHQRRYRWHELRRNLESAGFAVEYTTSFVTLLLPAMIASRIRGTGNSVDALRELRIAPPINAMFTGAMRLELALLRAGVRFPFGGSRLVVARRNA